MTTEMILWLLGGISTCIGAGTIGYINLIQRITRLESALIAISEKAAIILHSPDDHLGLDELLEKYVARHYELSVEEWELLHTKCEEIVHDGTKTKSERALAGIVSALCEHKLVIKHYIKV